MKKALTNRRLKMSWWVEPKEVKTRLTMAAVLEKIKMHDTIYKSVDFTNCIFEEEIELRNMHIPYSLDFQYSIFEKTFSMHSSEFEGAYIELTGAELRGGVYFTALKSAGRHEHDGYGIFLRNAKICGDIGLNGAGQISTLSIYGNEYFGSNGRKSAGAGFLRTNGASIERIILKGDEDIKI